MKKIFLIIFSSLILVIFGYGGKTFIIGVEQIDYYPLFEYNKNFYKGFARETFDLFAKKMGYKFVYYPYPVVRLYDAFLDDKCDFKFPDNPLWQSKIKKGEKIVYSDPVIEYIDGIMVLPSNKGRGIDNLKLIGTISGFTVVDYLKYIEEGKIKVYETPFFNTLINQAINNRINGLYANIDIVNYYLDNFIKKSKALVFDSDLPYTKSYYALSTIKHPEIIKEFNAFLKEEKNEIDNLKKKYGLSY